MDTKKFLRLSQVFKTLLRMRYGQEARALIGIQRRQTVLELKRDEDISSSTDELTEIDLEKVINSAKSKRPLIEEHEKKLLWGVFHRKEKQHQSLVLAEQERAIPLQNESIQQIYKIQTMDTSLAQILPIH